MKPRHCCSLAPAFPSYGHTPPCKTRHACTCMGDERQRPTHPIDSTLSHCHHMITRATHTHTQAVTRTCAPCPTSRVISGVRIMVTGATYLAHSMPTALVPLHQIPHLQTTAQPIRTCAGPHMVSSTCKIINQANASSVRARSIKGATRCLPAQVSVSQEIAHILTLSSCIKGSKTAVAPCVRSACPPSCSG
jgi:hypothetical protein